MKLNENKLLVSIKNYIQGIHKIFSGINANGREIWEIEHWHSKKKIELAFEIDLPVNQTQFSNKIQKTHFSHKLILVHINGSRHR